MFKCYSSSFSENAIELLIEMNKFEKALVDSGDLKDVSGASYLHFYQEIAAKDSIWTSCKYPFIDSGITVQAMKLIGMCKAEVEKNRHYKSSKVFELEQELYLLGSDSSAPSSPAGVAAVVLYVLDSIDMELPYYKLNTMITLAINQMTVMEREEMLNEHMIDVLLTKNKEVYLNDQLVSIDSVANKIFALLEYIPDSDFDKYKIRIYANPNTDLHFLLKAKNELNRVPLDNLLFVVDK